MKKDEERWKVPQYEKKFDPERLGRGMVAKSQRKRKFQKCGEQLQQSTFHEHM